MTRPTLLPRDVVTDAQQAVRLRVVKVSRDHAWLFDMDAPLAWPVRTDLNPLLNSIENNEFSKLEKPGPSTMTGAARLAGLNKYKRMGGALRVDALITKAGRACMFNDLVGTDQKLTRRTWHRAVRQFLRGGMTPTALAPRWDLSGQPPVDTEKLDEIPLAEATARIKEKALALSLDGLEIPESLPRTTAAGLLRRNMAPILPTRFRVDRDTLCVFSKFYDRLKEGSGKNLPGLYKELLQEVFSIADATGTLVQMEATRIPSLPQFRHWYRELRTHTQRTVARKGQHAFDLGLRSKVGDERSDKQKAGFECSGDATIWNVSIVSRCAGRRVVGCPVVFRIRCKRTGMLIGLAVSLANSSWTGMAAAIANCVEDKVAFCARYGIIITADEWPVNGLMAILEVDRGETHNHHPESFIEATGVDVINLTGQRPDRKPGVESDWRSLQVKLNGMTPGVLIETWQNTQNEKWKLNGEYDIDQFTRILLQYELARMKKPRDSVDLDDKMIAWGAVSSPLSMWQYSEAEEALGLSGFTLDEVQLSLMRREQAIVTAGGLLFKGMLYRADELDAAELSSKGRTKRESIPVTVAYDERLVDNVYLTEIDGEELEPAIVCGLNLNLEHQRAYEGRCLEEVIELRHMNKINEAHNQKLLRQADSRAHAASLQTTAEAKQANAAAPPKPDSKTQQMKDIPANRRDERFTHGPEHAFAPKVPSAIGSGADSPDEVDAATPQAADIPAGASSGGVNANANPALPSQTPEPAVDERAAADDAARKAMLIRLRSAQRA